MTYAVTYVTVQPQPLAVFKTRATPDRFGALITSSPVWEHLRRRGIAHNGHTIVVYHRPPPAAADPRFGLEIGVDVLAPFAEEEGASVVNGATPAGLAATTTHTGSYAGLGAAYDALIAQCRADGRTLGSTFWEVYGHWHEDPTQMTTTIFCGLQA